MNAMNRFLRDCIRDITMPFLDDIPIRECPEDAKDELNDAEGCRKFVTDHIVDCEKILRRLEGARLTFSGEKSAFRQVEILVVGHLCVGKLVPPDGRYREPANLRTGSDQFRPIEKDTYVNMPKSHICGPHH